MLELIAKYIVINHKFGVAKQEYEYLRDDRLKYHPNEITDDENELEEKVQELYHQREEIISALDLATQ